MSARSTPFLKRVALTLLGSGALWYLMGLVPAVMQVEQRLQRAAHLLINPLYQASSGLGTHSRPYVMCRFQEQGSTTPPFIVATGEDPEKIFDSNPLSPSDYAVLLDSMKNAGVEQVMIGSTLAWHQADPFALDALELVIAETKQCVTSAPVSRAAQADSMPPALVRASIPLSNVRGDVNSLTQVNRLAIPETVLGRENSRAGFSLIESETITAGKEYLLARWGERVIFSSALLAVCMREKIDPSLLEVEVGQSIFSPTTGHWWAIDEFGRTEVPGISLAEPDLLAPQLIRPESQDLSKLQMHFPPVHVLQQSGDDGNIQRQVPLLKTLYSAPRLLDRLTWHRLSPISECIVLVLIAILAVVIAACRGPIRIVCVLLLIGWWTMTLLWGATWVPVSPMLLAALMALLLAAKSPRLPAVISSPKLETSTAPIEAENLPLKQPKEEKKFHGKTRKKSSRSHKKS
jgi:hypothetical protein